MLLLAVVIVFLLFVFLSVVLLAVVIVAFVVCVVVVGCVVVVVGSVYYIVWFRSECTSNIFTLPVTWCGLRPSVQPQLHLYKSSELRFRKPINILYYNRNSKC
jgi:hypothetical protein